MWFFEVFFGTRDYGNIYNVQLIVLSMKSQENLVGAYALLIGVIITVALGISQAIFIDAVYAFLSIMGIVVGFASVGSDSKDATTFLLASVSLVIVSSLGQEILSIGKFGIMISVILDTLLIFFIPATIIVALKTVFSVARVS